MKKFLISLSLVVALWFSITSATTPGTVEQAEIVQPPMGAMSSEYI